MPRFCYKSYKFESYCGELEKSASPFFPNGLGTLEKNYVKSKPSPVSQGSISICLCCPCKAQPHDVTREAKIMGETALSVLAPACGYLQLQVAQNYLWSLKCLTFYFIPRTNSFLETFLRDKGTKKKKQKTKALDISAAGKEEPGSKHDFDFSFLNVSCIITSVSLGRTKLIPCLCNYECMATQSWEHLLSLLFKTTSGLDTFLEVESELVKERVRNRADG